MEKGFKQVLAKIGIFMGLFILISLIIGQKIVASSLLYDFKIFIYGGMGKIFLFSILGFILLYRKRLLELKSYEYEKKNILFLLVSLACVIGFYVLELNISLISVNLINTILIHVLFLSIFIFMGLGIFGLDFIKDFFKKFKKELFYFLVFGIIVYSLMNLVWRLWPYLSLVVLKIVYFLLKSIISDVQIIGASTLQLGDFTATIGEACSGIYSIFIFASLYLFAVLLDWKKLNKIKAILIFIPAVLGAFFANVLRVFLLFIFGAYVSEKLALGLYHSYTGMIFFLIYFAIFWVIFYKWMKKKEFKSKQKDGFVKRKYNKIMSDSLYKNSIYLMVSTGIMAVLGFFFWMICARLFSVEEIGLATTIISVMGLIVGFSILGLNIGLIRYLPRSKEKNKKINTCFSLVAIVSVIVSVVFILGLGKFSPRLLFIQENLLLSLSFIFFMIIAGLSSLIESVFVAFRSAKFVLIKNSVFSVLKIGFVFVFAGFGAYGIFSSWMIALLCAVVFSFVVLVYKFEYKLRFVFHDTIIRKIGKYSFGNYVAGFIGGLPLMVLPLMITNMIGPEVTAYYYMAMMIAGLLFVIPGATTQSLFAEGSWAMGEGRKNSELRDKNKGGNLERKGSEFLEQSDLRSKQELNKLVWKAVKIIALIMIPAIIIIVLFGDYILLAFGEEYSREGFRFLQIIAVSGVFVGVNCIGENLLRVRKKIKSLIGINILKVLFIIGGVYLLIDKGLVGIGMGWVIGNAIVSSIYLFILSFRGK